MVQKEINCFVQYSINILEVIIMYFIVLVINI